MGIMGGKPLEKDYEELMDRYDLHDISDKKTLQRIISMLNNNNQISLGQVHSDDFGIRTIIEQNWMIIKLLDDINKKLEKK